MPHFDLTTTFFLLICGHFIADFALQNEWIATNKNRHVRKALSKEEQNKLQIIWPHLMTAHAFHHGLMVFLVTQKLSLGIAETLIHWVIDYGKCERWYGFHADQFLHIACKALWVYVLFYENSLLF